jgi:hypothetical protein
MSLKQKAASETNKIPHIALPLAARDVIYTLYKRQTLKVATNFDKNSSYF